MFFAPSAADFVTPILKKHFTLLHIGNPVTSAAHVASIGPTTTAFLRDGLQLAVDVTAPKPSPDALASAVKYFDALP